MKIFYLVLATAIFGMFLFGLGCLAQNEPADDSKYLRTVVNESVGNISQTKNVSNENTPTPQSTNSLCEKIGDSRVRKACYLNLAHRLRNCSICEGIDDCSYCTNALKENEIVAALDLASCSKLMGNNSKDSCIQKIAVLKNDSSLCAGLEWNYSCYAQIARATNNVSMCNLGYNADTDCTQDLIINSSTIKICENVNVKSRAWCEALFKANHPANISDCIAAKPELGGGVNICYTKLAVRSKDPSFCSNIQYENGSECYAALASEMNDESICEQIAKKTYLDNCYLSYATTDEGVCNKINSSYYKGLCNAKVARKTGNAALCAGISDNHIIFDCYMQLAEKLGQTVCDAMPGTIAQMMTSDKPPVSYMDTCYYRATYSFGG